MLMISGQGRFLVPESVFYVCLSGETLDSTQKSIPFYINSPQPRPLLLKENGGVLC